MLGLRVSTKLPVREGEKGLRLGLVWLGTSHLASLLQSFGPPTFGFFIEKKTKVGNPKESDSYRPTFGLPTFGFFN